MKSNKKIIGLTGALMLLKIVLLLAAGCQREKPPIKIGFVLNQTNSSTLSIACRNGVLMAVDDINAAGGINGHKIELIIKDDRLDAETAIKVDRELIRENVAAIIGHVHSPVTSAAVPILEETKTVMISPVSATSVLTGLDDYLFRVIPPPIETNIKLAKYAFNTGLKKISVIYNPKNNNYAKPKYLQFKSVFEVLGGKIRSSYNLASGRNPSIPEFTEKMVHDAADGYLIIANPLDSAMICQHLRKKDAVKPILISPWACDQDFIINAGTAAEGIVLAHSFNRNSKEQAFLKFKRDFAKRFNSEPGMWEAYGYEAVMVLFQGLSENPDPRQLKTTLLEKRRFKGLQRDILFDRYGDNRGEPLVFIVKNGEFVEIK